MAVSSRFLTQISAPLLVISLLSPSVWADPSTDFFKDQTRDLVLNNADLQADRPHAFCFAEEGSDQIEGENTNTLVRIASVSKIATSYWALRALGPDYRFVTRIHYNTQSKALHIEGADDPFFGRARIYLLLSELNRVGIQEVSQVTFDSKFKFFLEVESSPTTSLGRSGGETSEVTKENLELFLNTDTWSTTDYYRARIELAAKEDVVMAPQVSFFAPIVRLADNSPFSLSGPVISFEFASVPLYRLLKHQNVVSHNYIADELFNMLGGKSAFAGFIDRDLGLSSNEIQMHTGSGLPTTQAEKDRKDNEATCIAILDILESMSQLLRDLSAQDLQDVMLVAGVDEGTLKSYTQADKQNSPLSQGVAILKTGYIRNSVSIAGQIKGDDGKTYFGIYLQFPNLEDTQFANVLGPLKNLAYKVRDRLIERFIGNWGGPQRYSYEKGNEFFAVDSGSRLTEYDPLNNQMLP